MHIHIYLNLVLLHALQLRCGLRIVCCVGSSLAALATSASTATHRDSRHVEKLKAYSQAGNTNHTNNNTKYMCQYKFNNSKNTAQLGLREGRAELPDGGVGRGLRQLQGLHLGEAQTNVALPAKPRVASRFGAPRRRGTPGGAGAEGRTAVSGSDHGWVGRVFSSFSARAASPSPLLFTCWKRRAPFAVRDLRVAKGLRVRSSSLVMGQGGVARVSARLAGGGSSLSAFASASCSRSPVRPTSRCRSSVAVLPWRRSSLAKGATARWAGAGRGKRGGGRGRQGEARGGRETQGNTYCKVPALVSSTCCPKL